MGAPCAYERLQRRRLLSSRHLFSVDVASASMSIEVPLKLSYPVDSKPYIPSLVHSFQERMGLSALAVEPDSLAHHLRSSWIRHALADPCLMHATLYAASAHLDTLRNTTAACSSPNPVTLYHQTETIAAVTARIASGGVLTDATIASVLLLVITGSLQTDDGATEAHRSGLMRMVTMRGGLAKLGFDGVLARMIQMNMVLPAVVFDLDQLDAGASVADGMDPNPNSPASSNLAALALESLGQSTSTGTSGNLSVTFHMTAIFAHVWELLVAVDCGEDPETGQSLFDFASARCILDIDIPPDSSSCMDMSKTETAMVQACQVSLRILRHLCDDRVAPQTEESPLVTLVEEMKSHIAATDSAVWLRYAAHANLWVTTLGLAVSTDVQGRLWFLMHERCVVMSMKDSRPAPHEMVWACYCWLRRLVRARDTGLDMRIDYPSMFGV
ncbi:uncharacterized protein DSM5745_03260 [Aspergillus mulundensis]|uniref:Uncharacterized protein n=1 Tax=Aspergillus mulundensis TaxID=1810919 RepID=A0A3D8SLE2_9EURO|nr:Uncharacterized protein DSM5745_03260 [Aspergillus mulundensis]RDW86618.1 Uncharacterized protein DSM5745_03260 [Aspergillus mulundensis]